MDKTLVEQLVTSEIGKRFNDDALLIADRIKVLKVNNPSDVAVAVAIIKDAQSCQKEIDAMRDGLVRPHNEYVRGINSLAKTLSAPFDIARTSVNKLVTDYNAKVLKRAELASRKLSELEIEEVMKIDAAREDRKNNETLLRRSASDTKEMQKDREEIEMRLRIDEDIVLAKLMSNQVAAIDKLEARAEVKGMRSSWTYEVINEDEIDRAFCSSDSKKLNEAIKAGAREIKGIRIYEKKIIC